jgi:long-subunit acyl-CoA synthetase (AMP-forming)
MLTDYLFKTLQYHRTLINKNYTYKDLFKLSTFYKNQFEQLGIRKNDRIMIESKKSLDFIAALVAGWQTRAIMVPVYDYRPVIDKMKPSLVIKNNLDFISLNQKPVENKDDIALILFTSGTSGTSKAVALSHENIISNLEMIHELYQGEITCSDHSFSILPWHHCYGLVCELLYMIHSGASMTISDKLNLKEIKKADPTLLFTVPKMIEKIYKSNIHLVPTSYLKNKVLWGNKLRMLSIGGSKCSKTHLDFLTNDMKIRAYQGYGMTELSPMIALNSPSHNRIGSVGKPLRGINVLFSNEKEMLVKSPSLMLGYIESIDETIEIKKPMDKDGWFHTGDKGYMDNDGFIYIDGRLNSDYKLVNGKFVFPEYVEDLILSNFSNIEQALLFPNQDHTENILLLYASKYTQHKHMAIMIQSFLNERIQLYELPSKICFLKEPMTIENNLISLKMEVKRKYIQNLYYQNKLQFSMVVSQHF